MEEVYTIIEDLTIDEIESLLKSNNLSLEEERTIEKILVRKIIKKVVAVTSMIIAENLVHKKVQETIQNNLNKEVK